jgi:hypothetical protein
LASATSCCALYVGTAGATTYNPTVMIWHRTFLALAFLIATVLGNVSFASIPMADTLSGMQIAMPADPMAEEMSMSEDCSACTKTAMSECISAVCSSAGALPMANNFSLGCSAAVFGRPADEQVEGPTYAPDPHPPKSQALG